MKLKYYIIGMFAFSLCTACNDYEEAGEIFAEQDEVKFSASLDEVDAVTARAAQALPYINGIYVRKIGSETVNAKYQVLSGNKGTLNVSSGETYLKWSETERRDDSEVHFYAWTTPTGVALTSGDNATTGTVNFGYGENEGNRAPKSQEEECNLLNTNPVTPLEVFISANTVGKYIENPNISLPFEHQVCKIAIQIRNDKNERVTDNVTIKFPLIEKIWNIKQEEGDTPYAFAISKAATTGNAELSLELDKLAKIGSGDSEYRVFYLPPMVGDNSFTNIGDFEITVSGSDKIYYGTLETRIQKLEKGQYMTCRIDLNENYGTGVGAWISPWIDGGEETAYADPYRGIYTVGGLKVLKEYLASTETNKKLPDSLYIDGTTNPGEQKIIRLYNDLDLSTLGDEYLSLALEKNMTFDGLGHTVTVPSSKSLFDITATGVEINNVRLLGAGQLANSLSGGKIYNCHANGSGNLVGTASGSTSFDFCSAEKKEVETSSATLIGTASAGSSITITNSFVATDATSFASSSSTVAAQNSFIIGSTNYYWASSASSGAAGTKFTIDAKNVTATIVGDKKLIDLLNEGSNTNSALDKKYWVYVYNKSYPVMRVK